MYFDEEDLVTDIQGMREGLQAFEDAFLASPYSDDNEIYSLIQRLGDFVDMVEATERSENDVG